MQLLKPPETLDGAITQLAEREFQLDAARRDNAVLTAQNTQLQIELATAIEAKNYWMRQH